MPFGRTANPISRTTSALLPWQGADGRKYGPDPEDRLSDIRIASKNIRIIHEYVDVDADPEFQKAHQLLSRAERLIFLGFGYDKTNLERLQVPNSWVPCTIFGSCYKLSENERTNLNRKYFHDKAYSVKRVSTR